MNEHATAPPPSASSFDPRQISRPEPVLLKYYLLTALLSGPGFPLVALLAYFKYSTLRYVFRDDGVSMSWGILFRQEIHLTYRRIQDIHLTRNIIQRWMGLATVSIQTASGSSLPEMSIEGVLQAEELRDFLYSKMRGGTSTTGVATTGEAAMIETSSDADRGDVKADEALRLLREIRDLTRELAARRRSES